MKTAFRKPPEWHGDDGTQWGYVNLSHVTHFVINTGEIGFVGGQIKTIAKEQCKKMAKALEGYEKPMQLREGR